MCLIVVVREKGVIVPDGLRQAAYDNNSNGFGAIWFAGDGVIEEAKVLPKDFDEADTVYKQMVGKVGAMHYRLTTVGETDLENVHPFKVCSKAEIGRDVYMCHNGTLGNMVKGVGEGRSDTWHFGMVVLRPMLLAQPDLLENESFVKWLESITTGNRVLIADGRAEDFIVLNKSTWTEAPAFDGEGVEHGTLLLSNTYSLRRSAGTLEYDVKTGKCVEKTVYRGGYYSGHGTRSPYYDAYDVWYSGYHGVGAKDVDESVGAGSVPPFVSGRQLALVDKEPAKCQFGRMCKGCDTWERGKCGTLEIFKGGARTKIMAGKQRADWDAEAWELVEFYWREMLSASDIWSCAGGNGIAPTENGGVINSELLKDYVEWGKTAVGAEREDIINKGLLQLVKDNPLGVSDYLRLWYKMYDDEWTWLLEALVEGEFDEYNPYEDLEVGEDEDTDGVDEDGVVVSTDLNTACVARPARQQEIK
jgi:hypothetical protein